jgi:hypothetical protein
LAFIAQDPLGIVVKQPINLSAMKKSSLIIAILLSTFSISSALKAQSSMVDPGISTHNYKHPNKAAKAKAQRTDEIVVSNIKTIETYSKRQDRYASYTPRYAPRPTPLVVTRTYQKEGVDINPLISPRNYKTPPMVKKNQESEVADSRSQTDSLTFPTID